MSVEYLVTVGIIFVSILLGIVFLYPGEQKKIERKKISQPESLDAQDNFEQKILRLERKIQLSKDEILEFQKSAKVNEKKLMVERIKIKKLQEKLSQERQWHTKEQSGIDKKGKEFRQVKAELAAIQENFSKAHAENLQFEHKVKELEDQNSALNENRRVIERENGQLKAKIESNRREIAQLTKENRQLTKKKEDASWVAKDEYERVTKLLKEKEQTLDQINQKNQK